MRNTCSVRLNFGNSSFLFLFQNLVVLENEDTLKKSFFYFTLRNCILVYSYFFGFNNHRRYTKVEFALKINISVKLAPTIKEE
jgi:hypothetical protein